MKQAITWKRFKIDQTELKKLTVRSDIKGLLQVVPFFLLVIGLGTLSYFAFKNLPLWAGIILFLFYATVFSFTSYTAAIHELSHNTVFKSKWLTEIFIIFFSIISWSDYVYFRKSHTQHHLYTTHKGLDKEVVQPIPMELWQIIAKFTFDVEKIYNDGYSGIIGIFRRAFNVLNEREAELFDDKTSRAKMVWWDRIVILFHLAVIAVAALTHEWLLLLLITGAIFFGQWYNLLVHTTQHVGLGSDLDDFRLIARSVDIGPIGRFLYWEMQNHVEHHMYAAVPCYNLKKLNAILKPYLPERKRLLPAWKEMMAAVKIQKTDPSYYIKVDVPN